MKLMHLSDSLSLDPTMIFAIGSQPRVYLDHMRLGFTNIFVSS